MMQRITTITVSKEVKEKLKRMKGGRSWDEFLLILADEYSRSRCRNGLMRLREIISEEELRRIEESHGEMHGEFKV
ncbi:hypothetical protein DFR87_01495 [Metallosphaera hakonensis JCM 8857 = DSM 7519]|uniref:VapB-type antitoxin n=2 Tax=Metallosphaera hakonensis TaxID=79601 RepID=A0A2U9IWL9_9CREN|nr:hypothetical protein DFR87_01495 [Metallosphaera hakonensis JCM 8857 = DSM 7519]